MAVVDDDGCWMMLDDGWYRWVVTMDDDGDGRWRWMVAMDDDVVHPISSLCKSE